MEEEKPKIKNKYIVKIQALLDKHFFRIFADSHIVYTLIFFISAIIIALLSFFQNAGDIILFLAVTFSLTFILLMFFGLSSKMDKYLFSTTKVFDRNKFFCFLIAFGISFALLLIYFLGASSTQLPIEFLGWDLLLPPILIVIYFGWNLTQIFFIKSGFEDLSIKINNKVLGKSNKEGYISFIFLVLGLAAPILMQLGTLFGFKSYFEPQNEGDPQDPLYWFIAWNVIMFIIIAITSWRLIYLYLKSRKNDSPNIFSSMFYIFIQIYIWYRSFSFIKAFRSETQSTAVDTFTSIIDILLMVATAILVLRGLGGKMKGSRIFNENNLVFFLFSFTILYIEGQIIMITGAGAISGIFSNQNQISLINNFLILLITIFFYLWYSEYTLERRGFIMRTKFNTEEVVDILKEYREHLKNREAIDFNKISDYEFRTFLEDKKLSMSGIETFKTEPKAVLDDELSAQETELIEEEKTPLDKNNIEDEEI
ncbi:MAG: hypothetical protein ACTSRI_00485 [Promethearchaeota archaeon]